jgi:ureidoglycolate lyase
MESVNWCIQPDTELSGNPLKLLPPLARVRDREAAADREKSMHTVVLQPLTAQAFAPFGDMLSIPAEPGRTYFERSLANCRANAWPSISMVRRTAVETLPLQAQLMERHEFSSQTIVPLGPARWLAIVAPQRDDQAAPDVSRAEGFLVGPGQGVTFGANIWHHPLTLLDQPAEFVVFMWREGTSGDEEFVEIEPFLVTG